MENYINDSEENPNDIELDWDSDNSNYIGSNYVSEDREMEYEVEEEKEQAEYINPDIDEIESDVAFPLNTEYFHMVSMQYCECYPSSN